MRGYPYLRNRKGHFYFRIAIPRTLRNGFGKDEFLYSLQTKDFAEARIRSAELYTLAHDVFQIAHAGKLNTAAIYLKQSLSQLNFKRSPGTLSLALISKINAPELMTDQDHPDQEDEVENISSVFKAYINECKSDRTKTLQKKQATLDLWLDNIGDMPVSNLGKAQARDFKRLVMRLPKNLTKMYGGKSVKEIDLDAIPQNERLSVKSINHQLGYMRAFINWATQNGYYEAANPFSGLALKDTERLGDKRLGFTQEQLRVLFTSPVYKGCLSDKIHERFMSGCTVIKDSLYWVPLIALYSGARLQEICQLYASDLKNIDGIWVFDFNVDGNDKLLKSASSKRKTPIHPALIKMGLLDHSDHGKKRLFPDLPQATDGTYSNYFSKRFTRYIERLGIKTNKTSFHSFRHTFIDTLRNTNVPREVRQALVGHLDTHTAHDIYGSPMGIKRLYEGVCQLEYKGVLMN